MSDYSSTYPTQRPVFAFDAKAGKLDSRISFSRADSTPSNVHYWSNEKHLSSDNLLLQSSNFDTSWSPNGINGTPTGGQADPAGGTDGFTVVEDSAVGAVHRIFQAANASGDLAFTVYAKQNSGTRYLTLTLFNAVNNWSGATFDLAGGSPATGSGSSSVFSSVSATQSASGNGYYKCTIKAKGALAGTAYIYLGSSTAAPAGTYGSVPYTGDGTSSLDIAFASMTTTGATDYNATTTQIHREFASSLKSVANAGDPRFEFDPITNNAEGLLIEASATNLQRYGSAFASWDQIRYSTVTSNSGIAPNGLLEADLAVPNSTAIYHYVFDATAVIANATTYTGSVYVKKAGHRYIQITASTANFGNNQWATFDLDDGSIDANNVTASAESVGNGWWRIQATMTSISAGTGGLAITFANTATGPIYPTFSGNDYDGVLLWGWQLETGSSASSLVNSGSLNSTITRASDSCSVSASTINYVGGPTTLLGDAVSGDTTNYRGLLSIRVDNSNYMSLYGHSAYNRTATTSAEGVFSDIMLAGTGADGKAAARLDTNNFAAVQNGGAVTTDTSAPLPDLSAATVYIGSWSATSNHINGTIKRVAIYNVALSDTELQAITS